MYTISSSNVCLVPGLVLASMQRCALDFVQKKCRSSLSKSTFDLLFAIYLHRKIICSTCADCPGFLVLGVAGAQASNFI